MTANKRYELTKKGIARNIYKRIKERCQITGTYLLFTSDDFLDWCINNKDFDSLYDAWVSNDYNKKVKPTVDRKLKTQSYSIDNIYVTTNLYYGGRDRFYKWDL